MNLPPGPLLLLGAAASAYLIGVLAGLLGKADSQGTAQVSLAFALLGTVLGGTSALFDLLGGSVFNWTYVPSGFTSPDSVMVIGIAMDPLSAFFVLLISMVGFAITLSSFGYLDKYVHERPATLAGFYALFLFTLLTVVLAGTVFLFLIAWEAMTIVSYFLVVHEHASPKVRRSGLFYLVISHAAGAAVLTSLLLLAVYSGSPTFAGIALAASHLNPWVKSLVFVAATLGFGTKAGLVPLHVWLPEAHPAAPSNVSALMSGVMIKVGIYGILRVVFQVMGGGPLWWGVLLLVMGATSALVGVLNAIAQHDIKRLLAFHSVENIGIIFMALGASLIFLSLGFPLLAALALLAGMLHTVNHALFKSLLFLGAGAVSGAAGTRDMEHMGGLARAMPQTALFFIVGAMAISGLPPLNGFVSEWLLFQAFFASFSTGSLATEVLLTAAGGVLALSTGLAGYCFVKASGAIFLARPRSSEAERVSSDAPATLRSGMAVLSILCILLGVVPLLAIELIGRSVSEITNTASPTVSLGGVLGSLELPSLSGNLDLGVVALVLAAAILVLWVVRRTRTTEKDRVSPAWDCGLDRPTSRMEYTPSGYAQPILRIFASYYAPTTLTETSPRGGSRPGPLMKVSRFQSEISYPWVEGFFDPLKQHVMDLARRTSRLQSGRIHAYLAYFVLTLLVLLAALWFFGGGGP